MPAAVAAMVSFMGVAKSYSRRIWRLCDPRVYSVARHSSSVDFSPLGLHSTQLHAEDLPWRTSSFQRRKATRIADTVMVQRLLGSKHEVSIFLPNRILGGLSIVSFQVLMAVVNPNLGQPALLPEHTRCMLSKKELLQMNEQLSEDKEFSQDMARDLAIFVENQKDEYEALSHQLDQVRRQQASTPARPSTSPSTSTSALALGFALALVLTEQLNNA